MRCKPARGLFDRLSGSATGNDVLVKRFAWSWSGAIAFLTLFCACGRDTVDLDSGESLANLEPLQSDVAGATTAEPAVTADPEPPPEVAPMAPVESTPDASTDGGMQSIGDAGTDAGFEPLPPCGQPDLTCDDPFRFCDVTIGRCVECFNDNDCPDDETYCSNRLGRCVPGCQSDRDCSEEKPECHRRQCVECDRDSDCLRLFGPDRARCEDFECRPCEHNGDCPDGMDCSDGACLFTEDSE